LYRYFLSQSLCVAYQRVFIVFLLFISLSTQLSPETFGYTLVCLTRPHILINLMQNTPPPTSIVITLSVYPCKTTLACCRPRGVLFGAQCNLSAHTHAPTTAIYQSTDCHETDHLQAQIEEQNELMLLVHDENRVQFTVSFRLKKTLLFKGCKFGTGDVEWVNYLPLAVLQRSFQ
jgi:hypothetical protein